MQGDYDVFIDFYGEPQHTSDLILRKDTDLYEFQNGLLSYIPQVGTDSLLITQYYYEVEDISTHIWWTIIDNKKTVLEVLEYNNSGYVQF